MREVTEEAGCHRDTEGGWEVLADLHHLLTLAQRSVGQPSQPILGPTFPHPALVSFHKY